jgi:hypothetical protein
MLLVLLVTLCCRTTHALSTFDYNAILLHVSMLTVPTIGPQV